MAEDDRLRMPIDDPYLNALGLAMFCFSRLEWDAVYVDQRIGQNGHNPTATADYISTISKKTAGTIAKDLVRLAAGITNPVFSQKWRRPRGVSRIW